METEQKAMTKCPPGKYMITTYLHAMAGIGVVFMIYGTVLLVTPPHESDEVQAYLNKIRIVADWISISVTLVGILLLALSAYFTPHSRDPDKHSMIIVAPVVILFVLMATAAMIYLRTPLNQPIIVGFAILSLSGAIFRALPFSEGQSDTFGVPLFRPWPWWRTDANAKRAEGK